MPLIYQKSTPNRENFIAFLTNVNNEFVPSLDQKISLTKYADKIISLANAFVCIENGIIIGALVMYCNNINTKQAYISLIAVSNSHRRQGVARRLIAMAIDYVTEQNFQSIAIHTNNVIALSLYQSMGFVIKSKDDSNTPIRYYLER